MSCSPDSSDFASYLSDSSPPDSITSHCPDDMICDSSDILSEENTYCESVPSIEITPPHKYVHLTPSCFLNGCVCGHGFEFRDMAYEARKRRAPRVTGVTIRPKTSPLAIKLRN
jgi:hypothetical protein